MLIFSALPIVGASGVFSFTLPNVLNWAFDYYYFLLFIIFLYIPSMLMCHTDLLHNLFLLVFPQLYGHMISQRSKVLGDQKTKAD